MGEAEFESRVDIVNSYGLTDWQENVGVDTRNGANAAVFAGGDGDPQSSLLYMGYLVGHNLAIADRTMAVWIYRLDGTLLQVASQWQFAGGGPWERSWSLSITSTGRARLRFVDDAGEQDVTTGSAGDFPEDAWVHLAVTFDGSDFRIYSDGVLKATVTVDTATVTGEVGLFVGSEENTGTAYGGMVDELAFFDSVLTAGQILLIVDGAVWDGSDWV